MSYVIFDCTQLITVNVKERKSIDAIKRAFESLGFSVKIDNQISINKLNYFKEGLYNTVIELVDKEFLGEFEDWKEVTSPPIKIKNFIEKTKDILKENIIKEMQVIIVDNVTENKEEDEIIQLVTSEKDIAKNLFSMSAWNFEIKANVLILKLIKE